MVGISGTALERHPGLPVRDRLFRQGYDYKTSSTTGSVHLDYILLPQLMCINITKFVQLQAGGQVAFLVSGKVKQRQ